MAWKVRMNSLKNTTYLYIFQLASLAASYVTKHIHLHTDARVNAELTDKIFSAMLVGLLFFVIALFCHWCLSVPEHVL